MSRPDLLLVDWLPRGGIPQSTAAWRDVARADGLHVVVVGRAGCELAPDVTVDRRLPTKVGALEAHVRLVRRAEAVIREQRPSTVLVQHTWAPLLERRVLQAGAEVGARTLLAVHNAVPHQRFAGLRIGMGALLADADVLLTHSHHVADLLTRPSTVLPLPELRAITRAVPDPIPALAPGARRRAVAFGVLGRAYKGVDGLADVAAALGADWEVVAAGVGAGHAGPGVRTHDGYLTSGQLRWLVSSADVVVLPYAAASQSAAVDVAQSLGAPPVASAVGGIPEQIDDGRTGGLVPVDAAPATWARVIERTAAGVDPAALQADAVQRHAGTARAWLDLVSHRTTATQGERA